jgi:hypothetical protein
MTTRFLSLPVFVALIVLLAGGASSFATSPAFVTKCQLPDGRLYFGPSPPPDCEVLDVYQNGSRVDGTSEVMPTPTVEPGN